MANESIQLRAKAKKLGIEGYKAMSQDELRAAIKRAEGKSGSGGKTAASKSGKNGTGRKSAGAKTASGRKSAAKVTKPAAKKSSAKKSSASTAKKAPAKSNTAKRPSSGGAGRVGIDNASIDWTAESNVGKSGGNREVIMKSLRKFKGNVDKVFAALSDNAQKMYPKTEDGKKRTKAEAQTLLRWHISRVKFDFVKDTGQHQGATRSKASSAPKSGGKSSGGKKAGATRKPAQKPAQGRKSGASRKPAAKKSAAGRKSAASRKKR